MTVSENQVYLSRGKKIYGPFSEEQIRQFEISGELEKYSWICRNREVGWKPTVPPPPSLPPLPSPDLKNSQPNKISQKSLALCYSRDQILSGELKNFTSTGCAFLQVQPAQSTLPLLTVGLKVRVNILNLDASQTETIDASVQDFKKIGGSWEYQLTWRKSDQSA